MNTTKLFSSWGYVIIECPTGKIIETDAADFKGERCYILDVARFDIAEWNDWYFRRYGAQPDLSELDILELGYWTKKGQYIPAEKWRYEIREQLEKEGKLKPYYTAW
jgi:hypothetical protein